MQGFVVETGAGLANATSYITTDQANTYLQMYGESGWVGADANLQQGYLMQASQSLDLLYGQEYYSLPQTQGAAIQGLLFPRFTFVINRIQIIQAGTIPVQIQRATAEVALMALNGTNIFPQPNTLPFTKAQNIKLGGLGQDTTYGMLPKAEKYPGFWKVEKILEPILRKDNNPSYLSL
jgi:hypothetical protein